MAGGEFREGFTEGLEGGLGVLGAAGVDRDRPALLLDPRALPGADGVEEAGEFGAGLGDAGVGGGAWTVPVTASQRSAP